MQAMDELDDLKLLREYAANNSETAFDALVSRRVNFVYSAALRQVQNPNLAEEITQAVFIILAQKAGKISDKTILTGWLFKTTRFAALAHIRAAAKRSWRTAILEKEFQMQSEIQSAAPDPLWEKMSPLLDEALAALGETDRQAVLLRFFENKSLAEVGNFLGIGEDTARKRVSRALEKLHRHFGRRGVTSTTAIIAGTISVNSVQAAPLTLAKSVTAVAIAKGTVASTSTLTLIKGALKIMAWAKVKTAGVIAISTLLVAGVGVETAKRLQEQQERSQEQRQRLQEQQQIPSIKAAQTENIVIPNSTTNVADLSSDQILKKAQQMYASLSSYNDTGQIISENADFILTNSFNIRLAHPNLYRIEWNYNSESGVCWSSDETNYVQLHLNQIWTTVRKESNPRDAIAQSSVLAIPAAFLGKIYSDINWGDTLVFFASSPGVVRLADEKIKNIECYVFNVKGNPNTYLWISKQDFLIRQIKTFGRNVAGKEFTFIETHENIITNQPFTKDDFIPEVDGGEQLH
ncbi:MAG TPA: sigma-70 family RNA polymerase sigma factor [Verrucomicrobiae bacterium]|jgi:RNA polymerase sigma factor (sigma-70 family)